MPTAARDYYEVLGVNRDADRKTIRDAFRELALRYHPDRNKEPDAEARFKEIAEAYAVLSDPTKRGEYDARGHVSVADLIAGLNLGDLFGGLGFGFGDDDVLSRFFYHRPAHPPRGADLEVELTIPLERVVTGGEEPVVVGRPQRCPACHGTGAKSGTTPSPCSACNGTGQRTRSHQREDVVLQQIMTCGVCQGRGTTIDEPCPDCGGRGETVRDETFTVRIPVGVEEGVVLRIPGHGQSSPVDGGAPGDVLVVVQTAPDPRFVRREDDLWHTATVEIPDAVLGASVEVPSLDGPLAITVPPGTQPEAVLQLDGKGLPRLGGGPRGNLYVGVQVRVPEQLTEPERKLYERLRALHTPAGAPGPRRTRRKNLPEP